MSALFLEPVWENMERFPLEEVRSLLGDPVFSLKSSTEGVG